MGGFIVTVIIVVSAAVAAGYIILSQYRKTLREAKNYERGLKMIPLMIHLPPASDDVDKGGRDERDLTEEVLSQAQVMYNIIASTSTKGFMSRVYGQRHMSFEIVATGGLVRYYVVVPYVLVDVVRQAVAASYPTARLEEVAEHTLFSEVGRMSGTIGGEFTLKKDFVYPIATYQESKRDASRALLNALSSASREDGVGVQILLRPAQDGWTKASVSKVDSINKDKGDKSKKGILSQLGGFWTASDILEALWKPPSQRDEKSSGDEKQLSSLDQATIEAIEEKTRYPGYEVLVRVVASSNTSARSQVLLKNVIAAFSLFSSPRYNGFKFTMAKNIEELVTSYIFRFFPQSTDNNILNSVELATLYHLPQQHNISSSQVERQMSKQVDGPTQAMEQGFLLGYNEFRGIKKQIRLSDNDRRRHVYIIGQTGTGKSVMLENLAYQDMLDGKGFAFVDPHGDSVETLIGKVPKERVEDIIYFNPGDMTNPIGLNMFEFDDPDQKDFLIQEAISMLYGLYDPGHTGIIGPRLEHIFRNSALLLMADPAGGTFIDIPKVLTDEEFRNSKLKFVKDRTVMDFWTKEWPASQRSSESGEVVSWVVSKFGPFMSNDAMRNIIGQTKSGFNLREIMDNKKILLANLSKGRMGELNSKLLGIIFVMKFQAAAMSRADTPEADRVDFSLYVDEFQNFATDSFETILSEARKYRLSLILGNQFMDQLTDKIRGAILGNVGTVVSGRIGVVDAEILIKKFTPTFEVEDLTKMPNYQSIASVMINNVPSAPFSMSFVPPMGQMNTQLSDALKRLSASKHGQPRAVVEKEIFDRLTPPAAKRPMPAGGQMPPNMTAPKKPSFLDEWAAKRQQLASNPSSPAATAGSQPARPVAKPAPFTPAAKPSVTATPVAGPVASNASASPVEPPAKPLSFGSATRDDQPAPTAPQKPLGDPQQAANANNGTAPTQPGSPAQAQPGGRSQTPRGPVGQTSQSKDGEVSLRIR